MTHANIFARSIALCALAASVAACSEPADPALQAAERFIDGFYSFDPATLSGTLDTIENEDEAATMLYYQAWAQAANYQVQVRRPCTWEDDSIACSITVTDDFGGTLGYTATDTFTLNMEGSRIVGVDSEGDDPPIFMELFGWITENHPEIMSGPCKDLFAGGETPADCARAVVASAKIFTEERSLQP